MNQIFFARSFLYKLSNTHNILPFYYQTTIQPFPLRPTMKSKTSLPSTKSIKNPTQKLIALKCKHDHFSYRHQLPPKKNLSSYVSAYHSVDHGQSLQNHKIEQLKKIIAPPTLDYNLLRRSLHESRHFSPQKGSNLPSLKIGSTYKASYLEKMNQPTAKGKEQEGFFIKMPWHENPSSNYRKSFESLHVQQHLQKGKPVEDHLKLLKTPFKAQSIYDQQFTSAKKSHAQNNSKDCIKNKDHLTGINCPLKGQSEYKSQFDKENLVSLKDIEEKKQLKMFPEINGGRSKGVDDLLPKKSLKMKKIETSPVQIENSSGKEVGVVR